jgi:hypothetical protein
MAIIETAVSLGENDGNVATASTTSDARKFSHDIYVKRSHKKLLRNIFLVTIRACIVGGIFSGLWLLLGIGARDQIVWKQLVGGGGSMSLWVGFFVPNDYDDENNYLPWILRLDRPCRAGKLHRPGMLVIKGVMVLVSVFINTSFVALAFQMGYHGSGYWWVTLLLLCLQFFVGMRITAGPSHWWVRTVAMAFYIFGVSAILAGCWGLCFLVSSSLLLWMGRYEVSGALYLSIIVHYVAVSYVHMMLLRYAFQKLKLDEQEELREHHVCRRNVFGDFRYIEKY